MMFMSGTIIYYHSSSSARRNQSCTDLRIGDQLIEFVRSPESNQKKKQTLNKTSSVPMKMMDLPGIEGGGGGHYDHNPTLQVAVNVEEPMEDGSPQLSTEESESNLSSMELPTSNAAMSIPQIHIQSPSPTETNRSGQNHFEYHLQDDNNNDNNRRDKSKQIALNDNHNYANDNHEPAAADVIAPNQKANYGAIDKSLWKSDHRRHLSKNNNKTTESTNLDIHDSSNEQIDDEQRQGQPKATDESSSSLSSDTSSDELERQSSSGNSSFDSRRAPCTKVVTSWSSRWPAGSQHRHSPHRAMCNPECTCTVSSHRCNCTVARGRNPPSHHDGPSVGDHANHHLSEHCSSQHKHNHHNHHHQPKHAHLNGPDFVRSKAEHRSSRSDAATVTTTTSANSGAIMSPMIVNPVLSDLRMEPDGENPHENPFPAKSRPKPIKFNIPSMARPLSNYIHLPPGTPSPTTPSAHYSTHVFSENGTVTKAETQHATLHIPTSRQSVHRVEKGISQSASVNSMSAMVSSPSSSSITCPTSNNPTTYVPILISTKDLEAAFLNEPPPMYGIAMDQLDRDAKGNTLPSVHSLNLNKQAAVKRTKSFQERIHKVLWGTGPPRPPSKPLACARLSILGKPLPCARVKSQSFMQERVRVYNFLQRPTGTIAVSYHSFVACLIIIGLMFFALSTVPDLEWWSIIALRVFDFLILAILSSEFLALFWASSCIGKYQGFKGAIRFIFSPFRLLDLLVIGISVVVCWTHWLPPSQKYFMWLRCGQVFQILRLENRFKPWRLLSSVLILQKKHMLITAYMCFLILIVLSYVVYFCEQDDPNTVFHNIPTSLYWGIITVTSIGYGDISPKTTAGRFIGGVLAILGMIVYAIPSGIIATGLALKVQESNRQKHINNRRAPAARLIQCAWRCYAASLNSTSEATWRKHLKPSRCSTSSGKSRKLSDMYNSLDQYGSKSNVRCSRFNLIEDDEKSNGGNSNRNSHNDLTVHSQELLTPAQKDCIRFIRMVKLSLARKDFKNAFRPYDIKDVMQQYSEGHSDVVGRVRYMQARINTLQAGMSSMAKLVQEMQVIQVEKMDRLERSINLLVERLEVAQQNASFGGNAMCGCCHSAYTGSGHYRSQYHHHGPMASPIYSEGSTIFAQTPTVVHDKHEISDPKSKRFVWPTMSEEDEQTSIASEIVKATTEESPKTSPLDGGSGRSSSSESIYSNHSCCTTTGSPKYYRIASKRLRHYSN